MRNFTTLPNIKTRLLFLLIILTGVFLRLYRLNEVPAGLYEDEVSVGYNAYSLLKTGQMAVDNRGVSLVYTLLTLPLVSIFGLRSWVVRLPSVLAGVGTLILVFYLSKRLFQKLENKKLSIINYQLSIIFLLAVSPWHIQFSRQVSDINLALFFAVLFSTLLMDKKTRLRKWLLFFASSGFLTTLLPELILNFKQALWFDFDKGSLNWSLTTYIYKISLNFFEYLNSDFLFFLGDTNLLRNSLNGEMGMLYFFSLPLLLIGIYHLYDQKNKYASWLSVWITAIFLVAAFNRYSPNARVSFLAVLPLEIISGSGLTILISFIRIRVANLIARGVIYVLMALVIGYNFLLYFHLYQHHFYKTTGSQWNYGYWSVNRFISEHWTKYDRIVVSNRYGSADIYSLFYQQIDPQEYFKSKNKVGFGKFIFQDTIDLADGVKTLWISDQDRRLSNSEPLAEFKLLNRTTVFLAWEL